MPLNPDAKRFEVPMSPEQYSALVAMAKGAGCTSTAQYVRDVLAETIPAFKAEDMPARGKYERKRCAWCDHIMPANAQDCANCSEDDFSPIDDETGE
jgi:hypothetical protein